MQVTRSQVVAFRWRRHQLGRDVGSSAATATDVLDLGIQDTGEGARWALLARCALPPGDDDLVWAWTLRGAPHVYRRNDIAAVAVATAPYSEADASKRVFTAAKSLKAADLTILGALEEVAAAMRKIVTRPTTKGELSGQLRVALGEPFLVACAVCDAIHPYEQEFRLATLQAGLELDPGTSPPVLRRIPGLTPPMYAHLATDAEPRFDVIRNYLRFFGPARHRDVAAHLDAPVKDVAANWPDDVEAVSLDGVTTDGKGGDWFVLAGDTADVTDPSTSRGAVRLLGAFDPYLQLRDRSLLVPEEAHRKDLWRTLGRPGAVVADGEVVGTWRPKTSGGRLTVVFDPWTKVTSALRSTIDEEAERLAAHRGVELAGVIDA